MRVACHVAALITLGAALLATRPALADGVDVARLTVQRARRAVVLGPFLGVAPGATVDGGDAHLGVLFGLDVSLFKVPIIPDAATVKQLVQDRVQARVLDAVKQAALGGRTMSLAEQQSLAEELITAVRDEFLRERRGRRVERPNLRVVLEAARWSGADAWASRLTVAKGVSKISIGPSLSVVSAATTELGLGLEASLQVLLSRGPRSPVADLFVRYDVGVTDGSDDVISAGVRLILDAI